MSQTVVITAIFGGKDAPKPFPDQSVPCDYFCITEENAPFPLPNLPDRLKAKFYKLQMHHAFPGYSNYIWIDGNIEVKSAHFVEKILDGLDHDSIVIQRHHERQTIKEEVEFILSSQNEYLTTRYGNQPLKQEYEWYLSQGMPESAQLFSCNIFGYKLWSDNGYSAAVHMIDEWWRLVLMWSWFDQSAFSYIAHRFGDLWLFRSVEIFSFGPMFDNPYFTLHPHKLPFG